MRDQTVPLHWAELVRNSAELAMDKDYDLAWTWFQMVDDPTKAAPLDANIITQDYDEHPANKVAGNMVNDGAGNDANKGDPNNPFDPLCGTTHELVQPWTS